MDVVAGLSSLSFESELTEDEKKLLYLRARSAGLTFCGCAHAAFVCQLLHSLRCSIKSYTGVTQSVASAGNGDLGVGILEKSLPAEVECFFNNRRLAAWADVMFLCCLPSHLPKICRDLRSHLSKRCLVYSFTSAVPVTRLAHLLGHDFIIKPQYEFVPCDTEDLWLSCCHLTKALTDPFLIEASCPLTIKGGITLSLNWVCAVLYSLMNVCTSASLGSTETISLINNIFKEKGVNNVQLHAHSFISSSVPLSDEFFPWISLIDAQTKDTPLLHFLSSSKSMQQCISALYKSHLERPLK
ncbi:NADP-dependent oxidoreductase domain-containing protein 1 isoform X4 [Melanotaenia boesemani]|uniref:NADP-dependent oxidoreductase domain-containing protein 1 isoform X4 n=1 Tax=Melanotaenia boesemani TaxID=1250792 RepID=UPI001C056E3D|nr:NADP-dependent oxidoreductase domain-containing protein 1 isoform X4 [Melanotaenia boesemani]